jgi:hypothetical protein
MSTRFTAFPEAVVTAITTPIGMKLDGIPIAASLPVVAPLATVIVAVYSEKVIELVTAPVVLLLTMVEKPFSDRTGPLNVVLAIFFSCLGKCQSHHCNCQVRYSIQKIKQKRKG